MSWQRRVLNIKMQSSSVLLRLMLLMCLDCYYGNAALVPPSVKPGPLRITKPQPPLSTIATIIKTLGSETTSTSPGPFVSSTTEFLSSTSDTTTNSIPNICNSAEESTAIRQSEFVQIIEGDIMLSIMTTDPASALFVINRLNQANLIEADFKIGARAIFIDTENLAKNLLIQEVQYMQQCIKYAMGIFIDFDLYKMLEHVIEDLEFNIWPIPTARVHLFSKVAHLLYQMPWGEKVASVEILTENLEVYNDFMDALRSESMCPMHFKSAENIYMLFGNKLANHFKENGTIFVVPTEHTEREFVAELPDKSFILMENEIELGTMDLDTTTTILDDILIGKSILPSRVLALAQALLDLVRWLKATLMLHCKQDANVYILNTCFNFSNFTEDWHTPKYHQMHEISEILTLLRMRKMANLMNFVMYQKKVETIDVIAGEEHMELLEIASQNFVTNVTTYYHFNRDNQTNSKLETKFGQVFNCQYSAGDNKRYPLLFDGESVMLWRIKQNAWVTTGMTAAILGIIATLAILVFIVVRITMGDVFEGNPVTSILLLLSLIVVFTSFVPFAMEYVGEQRSSHITFDDAQILNMLCAVRVFILTLVYCFIFSLLLCRAVMLASIGSEGGFLSHVNGYIQAVICIFSMLVQIGMSTQLLVVMQVASESVSCENIYYGHWLWGLVAYDFILLCCVCSLVPLIYRSQRNYREGMLIAIGAVLIFVVWIFWIVLSFFGDDWRDVATLLGLQATGWAVLIGILIPRTFLIVRGIERSDIAQALPSLTSLVFAQNNQYPSDQSVYECVNPAMHNYPEEERHQSPGEIPTLPLRGSSACRQQQQFFANLRQANANINLPRPPPHSPSHSSVSSILPPPDQSKITRF